MIVIVDYGLGNLDSIKNMIKKIGHTSIISNDAEVISKASALVLPGVGSFDSGMAHLRQQEIIPVLNQKVLEQGTPVLGICLGMQLFMEKSEEGELPGLGWIKGDVKKFAPADTEGNTYRIPHMGWNHVLPAGEYNAFSLGLPEAAKFYFVHSYFVKPLDAGDVMLYTDYVHRFASGIRHKNITGVQFHPEKSHRYGMAFLKAFIENH